MEAEAGRGDSGSAVSLELVLLVPVLVLLTVFVLWAGRGGRAELTADLAAEEAAVAASVCCEEGDEGAEAREAVAEEVLESRPGLEYLCVGGVRGSAGTPGDPEFVEEQWVDFVRSGATAGGVGVLGVRFLCETDGAVAPLRGLFPTITFEGQASEIVIQNPDAPGIGFTEGSFMGYEVPDEDMPLVFKISISPPLTQEVMLPFTVTDGTATRVDDFILPHSPITIPAGDTSAEIEFQIVDDKFYEGNETLTVRLDRLEDGSGQPLPPTVAELSGIRTATGTIEDDNDPEPHVFLEYEGAGPCSVDEGGTTAEFEVRLRDPSGRHPARSETPVTVDFSTADGTATEPDDYTAASGTATFPEGILQPPPDLLIADLKPQVTLPDDPTSPPPRDTLPGIETIDDTDGKPNETFTVELRIPDPDPNPQGTKLGSKSSITCTILDDEVRVSVEEGAEAEEGDPLVFSVMLARALDGPITLKYKVVAHATGAHMATPATACTVSGADFEGITIAQVTIPSTHSHLVPFTLPDVVTCDDSLTEPDETLWLEVEVASGEAVMVSGSESEGAFGTIIDNDGVRIQVDPETGTEGETLTFNVSLMAGTAFATLQSDVKLGYKITATTDTSDVDATVCDDYKVTSIADYCAATPVPKGTLVFPMGATTALPIEVELVADYVEEGDEAFSLQLEYTGSGLQIADAEATGTIENLPTPELDVDDFTGREGETGTFTVTLSNPRAGETVTVDYAINGTTAAGPGDANPDFEMVPPALLSDTLTFPTGVVSQTISVKLLHDAIDDDSEELQIILSDPTRALIGDGVGVGTIEHVDPPEVAVNNPSAPEGDPLVFTVTLSNARAGETVELDYEVLARSARAGADFVDPPDGTITLDSGTGTASVTVDTLLDKITENPETLLLSLTLCDSSASSTDTCHHSAALGDPLGVGTIQNVNLPVIRAQDATASEGGQLGFGIAVVDDGGDPAAVRDDVTVKYAIADSTAAGGNSCAVDGADFVHIPDSSRRFSKDIIVTNPFGVSVDTCADFLVEATETVRMTLEFADPNTVGAVLGDSEGIGYIFDSSPPELTVADAAADEGDDLEFKVTLSRATSEEVTVTATTEDATATAGDDYTAKTTILRFPPNTTEQTFAVATLADDLREDPDETLRVVLSGPSGALIDRAIAIGTIEPKCVDKNDPDQTPPTLIVPDIRVREGSRSTLGAFFSQPMCYEFQILVERVETSGANAAKCPADFGCLTNIRQSFPARNSIGASAFVPYASGAIADGIDEDDEIFLRRAKWGPTMPQRYQDVEWAEGTVTIVDADPPPTLTVDDGDSEAGQPVGFVVRLSAASAKTVEVQYSTADGTAAEPDDYTASSGTLTFSPGETSKTVEVDTKANSPDERDETFLLTLSMPDNALVGDGVGIGTIRVGDLPVLRIADASVEEGDGPMEFALSLSEVSAQDVSVEYATVALTAGAGAATEGDDYTADSGTLTIAAGDTSGTISVPIIDDGDPEFDETFLVELENPTGASLGDPSAVGTITGDRTCIDRNDPDETPPEATFDPASPEAEEDAGTLTVEFTLSEPFCLESPLRFDGGAGGTARLNEDFTVPRDTRLALEKHQTHSSVEFTIIDDLLIEPDETASLSLTSSFGAVRLDSGFTATIFDNDQGSAQVSVQDASAAEGGTVGFTVRLDRAASGQFTVDYAITADTATAGRDYTATSGTLTIAKGQLSAPVRVATLDDDLDEDDETFELELSNALFAGAALQFAPGGDKAIGTIVDDDPLPELRVSDTGAAEGDPLIFRVSLNGPSGRDVTVDYSTRDGTATAGSDYTTAAGTVTFSPGETSKTVEVTALGDADVENTERFFMDLSNPVNASLADSRGVGDIADATERELRVSDAVATEGGALRFEIDFDGTGDVPAVEQVTVSYRTVADTATAGDDYTSTAGTATIDVGQSSTVVTVATAQDSLDEPNERLRLVISDPTGAGIAVDRAVGLIIDDDLTPALTVDDPEATENGDGTPLVFTVRLSEPSGREVSVAYSTADGTATAGDDYTATSGTLTIPAGQLSATVNVALIDDSTSESAETLRLDLSGPSNALLRDAIGVGTIFDDESDPQIVVANAPDVVEAAGASAIFTVSLSRTSSADVTVRYSTADGTATADDDYTATLGTLTIPAGQLSATVTVALIDDNLTESAETFHLVLSNPSGNSSLDPDAAKGAAVIFDDESLPTLSVLDDPDATEGASAGFLLRLNRPSAKAITVGYRAVADPTAGDRAAAAGQDFDPVTGTATIAARSTTATVSVPLPDDALDEFNETFWLRLANPSGAVLVDATAVGTIVDNDPPARLSIADATATEGGTLTFAVRLAPVSGRRVTVPWETVERAAANAATPGADFIAASGALTFTPGTTQATVTVSSRQDNTDEPDETLLVQLGEPENAVVEDGVAVGAILDDDGLPRISISDASVDEGESPLSFSVSLSRPSSQTVSVEYTIDDGTAMRPDDFDYFEQSRTLVIAAGTTEGEISVYIVDDDTDEGIETFSITLSNAQNAVIAEGRDTATGVISDDESALVSIKDTSASESDGKIDFEVSLSAIRTEDTTVSYTTFDGSATQPDDYLAATGRLTIPAGDDTATISVNLVNDSYRDDSTPWPYGTLPPRPRPEPAPETESFLVRLSSPTGAALGDADAAGVIIDDDELPFLQIASIEGIREDAGTVPVEVRLQPASNRVVTVDYMITSTSGADCASVGGTTEGTLTFQPGDTAKNIIVTIIDKPNIECSIGAGATNFGIRLMRPSNAQFENWHWHLGLGGRYIPADFPIYDVHYDPPWAYILVGEEGELGGLPTGTISEKAGEAVFRFALWYPLDADKTAELGWYFALTRGSGDSVPAATAGEDYMGAAATGREGPAAGRVTIPAGTRVALMRVPIIDDDVPESIEDLIVCTFSYTINGSPPNLRQPFVVGNRCATVYIHDDDTPVGVKVSSASASETSGNASVLVELDQVSGKDVTVDWATAPGTATAPGDYTSASGTVEFKAGTTRRFVEVAIVDDDDQEGDETFDVVLSNASDGATIAADGGRAEVTIIDDEGANSLPVLTIYDANGLERDGGTAIIVSGATNKRVTKDALVQLSPVFAPWLGDEAADSSDLSQIRRGTLKISKGTFREYGALPFQQWIDDDDIPELDERFMVMLHSPVDIALGNNFFWVTLIDDDVPEVTVADETVAEDGAQLTFTLQLHAPAVKTGTVEYEVLVLSSAGDRAAVPGQDYTPVSGTVTFSPGDERATVVVPVLDDAIDEADKRFLLLLRNPKTLVLADASAVGTIRDDDDGWVIEDRRLRENAGPMVFTLTRDHTSTAPVTVNYDVTGASAAGGQACTTAGVDYVEPSGAVTLQPADTQATISIELCDDSDTESRETLLVELTGVPGRKISATGTIIDDD